MRKAMKMKMGALLGAMALLFSGAAVATASIETASAEAATPKMTFYAANLVFKHEVNLLYAAKLENVEPADVKVLVWNTVPAEFTFGTQNDIIEYDTVNNPTETINGTECHTYEYDQLVAKQMTDEVYTRLYAEVDGQEYYSEPLKYSILRYAYNMLGKTDATPTGDENLKAVLNSMLSYGAAMQTYRNYKADRLATADFVYVEVPNATFEDGFNYGLFKKGAELTITPDEGYKLSINANSAFVDNGDGTVALTVPDEAIYNETIFVLEDTVEKQEAIEFATFELGDDGSGESEGGAAVEGYTETVNGYTLNITGGSKMYTGARDLMGNGCIKFGTSSVVGSCLFTVPADVTEVVLYVAKYKAKATIISVNEESHTLMKSSNDGEYDEIVVDTTTNKTVNIATMQSGNRAMMNSIVFKGIPASATDKVAAVVSEVEEKTFENVTAVGSINLPKEGTSYSDVAITWTMGDGDYTFATLENGVLTINELPAEDTDIILVATVTCDEVSSNPIEKTVKVDVLSDADKLLMLEQESGALTFDSLTVDGNETIDLSNKLNGSLYSVIEIEWTAGTGATITDNVLQFANPDQTTVVTVKATLKYDTQTVNKEFSFTVNHVDDAEPTYSYTFTAKQFSKNETKELNGVNWTVAGDGGYWGYDGTKGQQLGSGGSPYESLTLTSGNFSNVSKIVINTSGASSINATLTVTVGGTQVGSSTKLTSTATDYTFTVDDGGVLTGAVVFTFTQTSFKAMYIKSITVYCAE